MSLLRLTKIVEQDLLWDDELLFARITRYDTGTKNDKCFD